MGQVETGDWILLGNVGLADCRDLDMILLDKDYRYNSGTKPGVLEGFQIIQNPHPL